MTTGYLPQSPDRPYICFVTKADDGHYIEITTLKTDRHKYPHIDYDHAYKSPEAKWRDPVPGDYK